MKTLIALTFLAAAVPALADSRIVNVKTSLLEDACILIDADSLQKEPEIDFFQSECPGIGGFRVMHNGGDLRSQIELVKGRKTSVLSSNPAGFSHVGSADVTWAFTVTDNKRSAPIGILYQVMGQDMESDDLANQKDVTYNVVAAINGDTACIVSEERDDGSAASAAKAIATLNAANTLTCKH